MPVCQVASAPLTDEQRRKILPGGQAMTDLQPDVLSLRFDSGTRLITAYPLGPRGHRHPRLEKLVNARLAASLPWLGPLRLDYAWTGIAAINPSLLPRFFQVEENFFALQACNGRGLALNTVLGRDLAGWLAGGGDWALAVERPQPIAGYVLAQYLPLLLMKLALLKQSLNDLWRA